MNDLIKSINEWVPTFLPILGIGLVVAIIVKIVKTGNVILDALKNLPPDRSSIEHQTVTERLLELSLKLESDEKPKREYVDDTDDEKPKRQFEPQFMLGDDGELLEVIDDKPKRGLYYDG